MKLSKEEIEQLNEFIFCEWDKRKKCDSLYQEKYNELAKRVHKAIEIIEDVLKSWEKGEEKGLNITGLIEILKGEQNEE